MAVRDFSSLYPEYQVEFVDYEAQYGEQADQQLLMDLLYGQSPDLLFVNGLPYEVYARQGLLEDLYPWIDADETLSRTDFTQNLLRALETTAHCTACRRPTCWKPRWGCRRPSAGKRAGRWRSFWILCRRIRR